jgi:TolB protein
MHCQHRRFTSQSAADAVVVGIPPATQPLARVMLPMTTTALRACFLASFSLGSILTTLATAQPAGVNKSPSASPPAPPLDWPTLEASLLSDHLQLTSRDQFVKAGEAYFSPDDSWVIFQATPVPEAGKEPDPFYAMYIARVVRTGEAITGLDQITRISPPGSANTCGWFHPTDPTLVIYGSTLARPADDQKSGFQVGTRRYVWMFPDEMEIVQQPVFTLQTALCIPSSALWVLDPLPAPKPLFEMPHYDAECSYDPTGRFVLYTRIEPPKPDQPPGKPDGNIYIFDTKTNTHTPIITAPGYDGGPFFSPDGTRICYRSDRKGDDKLQLFIADLKFETDPQSVGDKIPVGISTEYQVTANEHVNWAPFFHPSGNFLVYGTSEISHANYEIMAVPVDPDSVAAAVNAAHAAGHKDAIVLTGTKNAGAPSQRADLLPHTRLTHATGADVLPAFTNDGKWMMWTSQRGPKASGEERPSSQLWIARWKPDAKLPAPPAADPAPAARP